MRIKDKTTFKSGGFYNLTAQVQENTLLNRGLLDLGGIAVPQMIMSNNKDEKNERGVIQGLYFITSFVAPFIMLPFFNKTFLLRNGIVKNFNNNEKRIIEVSKKYLTKDANFMIEGIRNTAKQLDIESKKAGKNTNIKDDFENILNRFSDKDELKAKLLKTHEHVFTSDFLATSLMWCATPWAGMEFTKFRTKRSGFSATYSMIDENQSRANASKHEKEKKKKLLYSGIISIIPAIIFPKIITKGIASNNKFLNVIKKMPQNFNYTKGVFPSKTIIGAIWLLCDYPANLISARDKYERRDRAIRGMGTVSVFFFGDFILNNLFGRLSDKILKTEIMDRSKINNKSGFLKKIFMKPKTFAEIEDLKNISIKTLRRTKNVGSSLYWLTLVANMGLLGFAMPNFLNKMLKKSVKKDTTENRVAS